MKVRSNDLRGDFAAVEGRHGSMKSEGAGRVRKSNLDTAT